MEFGTQKTMFKTELNVKKNKALRSLSLIVASFVLDSHFLEQFSNKVKTHFHRHCLSLNQPSRGCVWMRNVLTGSSTLAHAFVRRSLTHAPEPQSAQLKRRDGGILDSAFDQNFPRLSPSYSSLAFRSWRAQMVSVHIHSSRSNSLKKVD